MKRLLSVVVLFAMIFSCIGCSDNKSASKKELEKQSASEIYDKLKDAYEVVNQFGGDIQQVWANSATQKKEILADPVNALDDATHLDAKEITIGIMVATDYILKQGKGISKEEVIAEFREKSEDEIEDLVNSIENSQQFFQFIFSKVNPLADFCVLVIQNSYQMNGTTDDAQEKLDTVKEMIKELNSQYPDFEGNEDLKNIYTQTAAYFEFCINPTGNLIQAMDTIKEYQQNIKSSMSEVEFLF